MKLRNLVFVSFLLCTPVAFANLDKGTNTKEYTADTTKFIGYSTSALTNAGLSLGLLYHHLEKEPYSALFLALPPAILAASDAKAAWEYYKKAFLAKNKIEQSTTFISKETEASSTKNVHMAKLIGYSGLALITTALGAFSCCLAYLPSQAKSPRLEMIAYLLYGQVFFRFALSTIPSIRDHCKKAFPSNDSTKKTPDETA